MPTPDALQNIFLHIFVNRSLHKSMFYSLLLYIETSNELVQVMRASKQCSTTVKSWLLQFTKRLYSLQCQAPASTSVGWSNAWTNNHHTRSTMCILTWVVLYSYYSVKNYIVHLHVVKMKKKVEQLQILMKTAGDLMHSSDLILAHKLWLVAVYCNAGDEFLDLY